MPENTPKPDNSEAPESFNRPKGWSRAIATSAMAVLFVGVALLVVLVKARPFGPLSSGLLADIASWTATETTLFSFFLWVCVLAVGLLLLYFVCGYLRERSRRIGQRILLGLLVSLTLTSGFAYFYGYRGLPHRNFIKIWDLYHYYLGPKYFAELGYTGLYEATVVASRQHDLGIQPRDRMRDLCTYRIGKAGNVADSNQYVARFTPERWDEFCGDLSEMRGLVHVKLFRKLIGDHGFNGTPVWTTFGAALAEVVPATQTNLHYLALLDILLLVVSFIFVIRAFGPRRGLLFAVLYFACFTNRFLPVGASFLRYAWMACLATGLSMLKLRHHFTSGALLALAALLNVFPVVFCAGVGVRTVRALIQQRRLPSSYARFLAGFALCAIVLVTASMTIGPGLDSWTSFADQMDRHSVKLTSSRVGFQYLFIYHGEVTVRDAYIPYPQKMSELRDMQPWLGILMGAILLWGLALSWRLDDTSASILLGFTMLFVLLSMVQYYYAMMPLLFLVWTHNQGRKTALAGQVLLYACFAVMIWAFLETNYLKFVNNTATSSLLTLYLAVTFVVLSQKTGLAADLMRAIIRGQKRFSLHWTCDNLAGRRSPRP